MKRSAENAGLAPTREEHERQEAVACIDLHWDRLYEEMARAYVDRFDEFPVQGACRKEAE